MPTHPITEAHWQPIAHTRWEAHARLHVEHLGLPVDDVIGDVWAEQKGVVLRDRGASIYVGDHLGDVRGAKAAGAFSVSVGTGPISVEEFRAANTDVVLTDLREFPAWLDQHLPAIGGVPATSTPPSDSAC